MENKWKEYSSIPQNVHTPSSIINIFNNALSAKEDKKIVIIQGMYESKGSKNYSGYYYDQLKDELGTQSMTIMIPELLREELKDGYTYKMKGYLNRKILDDSTIKLNFGVVDILSNEGKRMSSKALKVFDIRKQKSDIGYRNLEEPIKRKLHSNQSFNIALICGNEAIIDKDIYGALQETINCYNITEYRVGLTSKEGIIEKINEVNNENYDVVLIARGGGSGLEIFNDTDIAEAALSIRPIFITAIGHAVDNTLLQDIADKKFDTPTALGNYLKEIARDVINEIARKKEEKEHESNLIDEYEEKLNVLLGKSRKYEIVLLIIGIIVGIIISRVMK